MITAVSDEEQHQVDKILDEYYQTFQNYDVLHRVNYLTKRSRLHSLAAFKNGGCGIFALALLDILMLNLNIHHATLLKIKGHYPEGYSLHPNRFTQDWYHVCLEHNNMLSDWRGSFSRDQMQYILQTEEDKERQIQRLELVPINYEFAAVSSSDVMHFIKDNGFSVENFHKLKEIATAEIVKRMKLIQ